jgi:hypothetical protein
MPAVKIRKYGVEMKVSLIAYNTMPKRKLGLPIRFNDGIYINKYHYNYNPANRETMRFAA